MMRLRSWLISAYEEVSAFFTNCDWSTPMGGIIHLSCGFSGIAGEVLGGNSGGLQESLNDRRSRLPDGRAGVASLQGKL